MNNQPQNHNSSPKVSKLPPKKLLGFGNILNESFLFFSKNFGVIITISLLTFGISSLLNSIYNTSFPEISDIFASSASVSFLAINIILTLFLGALGAATLISSFNKNKKNASLAAYFQKGFKKLLSMAGLEILLAVFIAIGFILLIIPGVVFLIWFMFAPFFLILENDSITASIGKSKNLVKGYWGFVFSRYFLYIILAIIISFVLTISLGIVGNIIVVSFISPLTLIFNFIIYKNLWQIKAENQPKS